MNDRLRAYLNYFERLATQPSNRWDGFAAEATEEGYFGLRFQLGFLCYALAALCLHPGATPEEQERCRRAMGALLARMLQRRVWAYWGIAAERQGTSPDPLYKGNLQYSAQLGMMIGAYEAAAGDARFDEGFTLHWSSDERFDYTHTLLIETLAQQMRANAYRAAECAPGIVYPSCVSHALWALRLHDNLHGSDNSGAAQAWIDFMSRRLALGGPRLPGRGALSAAYATRSGLAAPFSTNFGDAWSLALLAPLAPEPARSLASRFLPRIRRLGDGLAYAPSAGRLRRAQRGEQAAATAFAYLLAVELDNTPLAESLLRYADSRLDPSEEDGERRYQGCLAPPLVTALFALGEAGGLRRVLEARQGISLASL
jgi:hypothetical protein